MYFLFFSAFFWIKNIAVTGNNTVSEDSVKALIPIKNIFLIDIENIQGDILDSFLQIDDVKIRRSLPDALNIAVSERSAAALWCEEEKCFFVDNDAVIFGEYAGDSNGLIKIMGVKEMLNKEKMSQILDIQKKMEQGLIATTTRALILSEERLNAKTSEGWEAYFNLKGDLDWQIQELGLVLEKQISPEKRKKLEYIDLRFSKVYYK